MPLHELQRRDSWPPTQVQLSNDSPSTTRQEILTSIDENPFSFFLTSPDEIDIDDYLSDDDLNAGIETPDSSRSPVREVSPSALQRNPLPLNDEDDEIELGDDDDEEYEFGFGMAIPLTLKDFARNTLSGRKSRTGHRSDDNEQEVKGLGITLPDFSGRGRARVKMIPVGRGRGVGGQQRMSRSLSARRPASWRAPSPEIFSIREERESDEEERGKLNVGFGVSEDVYSVSAPASSRVGILASPGLRPKEKKRVHWAL